MNRIKLIIALILVILCFSCARKEGELRFFWQVDPAEKLFDTAEKQYEAGAYDNALVLYQAYLAKYPDTPLVPAALIKEGLIRVNRQQYEKAHAIFQRVIEAYPASAYALQASVEELAVFYRQGKFQRAINYSEKLLAMILSRDQIVRVSLIAGDSYMALQSPKNAYAVFLNAYGKARSADRQKVISRLKAAISLMSPSDISLELETLNGQFPSGYLMYQQGLIYMNDGRLDDAVVSFSDFVDKFPDHEDAETAKQLIADLESSVLYDRNIIGCILPLSGKYEFIGHQALAGIEFALATFSRQEGVHLVKILIKDSVSDPALAQQAVKELADSHVSAIIGPIITAESAATAAQELRVPIITMTQKPDITDIGDYVFRNFLTPGMQIKALVSYAAGSLDANRFAILYPDESYGKIFMNLFWDETIQTGGTIVGVEAYDPKDTDFADPVKKLVGLYYEIPEDLIEKEIYVPMVYNDENIARIMRDAEPNLSGVFPVSGERNWVDALVEKAPVEETGEDEKSWVDAEEPEPVVDFDAVFIPDSPNKAGLIIPQLAYYDIKDVYLLGTNLWHSEKLVRMAKDHIQGAILPEGFFAQSASEAVKKFVWGFKKTYDSSPGFIEAVSYDTAMILFDLVSRPEVRFRTQLKQKLVSMEPYFGVTGKTVFDENGEAIKDIYLLKIDRGRFREVKVNR
ncbi:MAG: ABC transporter substrate-binding protein [Dissulfuribacterales bacterium]